MKNLIVTALLIVGISSYAQVTPEMQRNDLKKEKLSPEKRSELKLEKMTAELNLTAAERQEFSKLFAERKAKHTEFKNKRGEVKDKSVKWTPEQKAEFKKKRQSEKAAYDARVKNILDAGQYEKWTQMKAEKKEKHKMRNSGKEHKKGQKKELKK